MDTSSFSGLINNGAILLALGVVYDSIGIHRIASRHYRNLITGVLVGLLGIAILNTPWEMVPGVFFDTRAVLLFLCGLFFGLTPTLIAASMAVSMRLYQGGTGMWVGSLVILVPACIGMACHYIRERQHFTLSWWRLYLLGMMVQVVVLMLMLLMPAQMRFPIIYALAPTTLTVYPVLTMLLGLILRRQGERRRTEKALIVSQKALDSERSLLRELIDALPDQIFITDTKGRLLSANQAYIDAMNISEHALYGKEASSELKTTEPTQQELEVLQSGKSWQGEVELTQPNGKKQQFETLRVPYKDSDDNVQGLVGINHDITQQKAQEEKILRQAHFDSLTGLPNRFLSLNRLDMMVKSASRNKSLSAVMFLDLDDFKKVNDSHGHDTGDQLLIGAAQRLQNSTRDIDTVGRLGGDEFIILMDNLSSISEAERIARNLLEKFQEPMHIDGRDLLLTMSIGIAIYPNDGHAPSELLRSADTAMYFSKAQGRNTLHFFTEQMNIELKRRVQLEEQLHHALARKELELQYQPILDLKSKRIVGAEALLRWHCSALGDISSDEFIPIAEQTGLIIPIGEYVLNEALNQTGQWVAQLEPEFKISINISPRQFRDQTLSKHIAKLLERFQLSGKNLEMEITEGVLVSTRANINEQLQQLSSMQVSISMDDFGTGYSSLSYLRNYPFDTLKIDRSFVCDITLDTADQKLVNAAIDMAHALGIQVVAEGVETEDQLKLLREKLCDRVQGYLISRPIEPEKITEILKAQSKENQKAPVA